MLPRHNDMISNRKWWIAGAIYVACAAAFLKDINDIELLPYGIFYLPVVGTSVFYRDPRAVWVLAGIASVMVGIGYFLPAISESPFESALNRGGSIVAIFVTAGLLRYARQIQEALIKQTLRAERGDQAKARLLTNLSRELVTPLNSIIGFSELLQESGREDQQEFIGYVLESGRGLLSTFRNLIDVTTQERRHLQIATVTLQPVVERAVRTAMVEAARHRVCIRLAVTDAALAEVRADAWAVRRVLENLLSNAVKFSNAGSEVTVSLLRAGPQVAVLVEDTGIGMTPEVVSRLGELFFQAEAAGSRKFEGMGAGLALCVQLVAAMGGKLAFDSAPGRGTAARLTLPVAQRQGAPSGTLHGLGVTPG